MRHEHRIDYKNMRETSHCKMMGCCYKIMSQNETELKGNSYQSKVISKQINTGIGTTVD